MDSRAFVKGIMGPVGGGKSTAALFELLSRAIMQEPFNGVRRTKFGILRNTVAQLRSTVKPLIDTWFQELMAGRMGKWTQTQGTLTFEAHFNLGDGTVVQADFMLLAADTPDDVRRLLSLELTAAWVEEAREVDQQVFEGLLGRVDRFPSRVAGGPTYPGVTFSTNPPALGTFWHGMISGPPKNAEVFRQPPAILDDGSINPEAENLAHLGVSYYENLLDTNTSEWVDVYLKNNFGQGNAGKPVFKASFKPSFHIAKEPLKAVPQAVNPLIVGVDNGLQAAAVVTQQDMRGRVNLLAEAYVPEDTTMGFETFLDRILIPTLTSKFPSFPKSSIVFAMDPACWARAQLNEKTLAMAVSSRGYHTIKASTNDPERRVQAVEGLLARQIDGGPGFLIDPTCTYIAEAMEWGFRYKNSTAGGLAFDKSMHHNHIADALQYACLHYNAVAPGARWDQRARARPVKKASYVYAHG